MTPSEIITIVNQYDQRLAIDTPEATQTAQISRDDGGTTRSHVRWMCQRVPAFVADKPEKANRWLGFIQGYLWVNQDFTIEEMRHHNKGPVG